MEKTDLIVPSLLSADFLHLKREMDNIAHLGLKRVHFDVMDGNFVEEISFASSSWERGRSPSTTRR